MLTYAWLSLLEGHCQIHRLIERSDPSASVDALEVSNEMLVTVLQHGSARERATFLPKEHAYIVSNEPKLEAYDLPAKCS